MAHTNLKRQEVLLAKPKDILIKNTDTNCFQLLLPHHNIVHIQDVMRESLVLNKMEIMQDEQSEDDRLVSPQVMCVGLTRRFRRKFKKCKIDPKPECEHGGRRKKRSKPPEKSADDQKKCLKDSENDKAVKRKKGKEEKCSSSTSSLGKETHSYIAEVNSADHLKRKRSSQLREFRSGPVGSICDIRSEVKPKIKKKSRKVAEESLSECEHDEHEYEHKCEHECDNHSKLNSPSTSRCYLTKNLCEFEESKEKSERKKYDSEIDVHSRQAIVEHFQDNVSVSKPKLVIRGCFKLSKNQRKLMKIKSSKDETKLSFVSDKHANENEPKILGLFNYDNFNTHVFKRFESIENKRSCSKNYCNSSCSNDQIKFNNFQISKSNPVIFKEKPEISTKQVRSLPMFQMSDCHCNLCEKEDSLDDVEKGKCFFLNEENIFEIFPQFENYPVYLSDRYKEFKYHGINCKCQECEASRLNHTDKYSSKYKNCVCYDCNVRHEPGCICANCYEKNKELDCKVINKPIKKDGECTSGKRHKPKIHKQNKECENPIKRKNSNCSTDEYVPLKSLANESRKEHCDEKHKGKSKKRRKKSLTPCEPNKKHIKTAERASSCTSLQNYVKTKKLKNQSSESCESITPIKNKKKLKKRASCESVESREYITPKKSKKRQSSESSCSDSYSKKHKKHRLKSKKNKSCETLPEKQKHSAKKRHSCESLKKHSKKSRRKTSSDSLVLSKKQGSNESICNKKLKRDHGSEDSYTPALSPKRKHHEKTRSGSECSVKSAKDKRKKKSRNDSCCSDTISEKKKSKKHSKRLSSVGTQVSKDKSNDVRKVENECEKKRRSTGSGSKSPKKARSRSNSQLSLCKEDTKKKKCKSRSHSLENVAINKIPLCKKKPKKPCCCKKKFRDPSSSSSASISSLERFMFSQVHCKSKPKHCNLKCKAIKKSDIAVVNKAKKEHRRKYLQQKCESYPVRAVRSIRSLYNKPWPRFRSFREVATSAVASKNHSKKKKLKHPSVISSKVKHKTKRRTTFVYPKDVELCKCQHCHDFWENGGADTNGECPCPNCFLTEIAPGIMAHYCAGGCGGPKKSKSEKHKVDCICSSCEPDCKKCSCENNTCKDIFSLKALDYDESKWPSIVYGQDFYTPKTKLTLQ